MTDTSWFIRDRFGMFVHFGLYSLAARHEWVMMRERIAPADYERYADHFNPDLFDAGALARRAREAGMRYMVLTTKHHDGFCLWDSALTTYTSVHSPFRRDIVREFVEAARREDLRVGLYHSLLDWHHPDFAIDALHPLRDDEAAVQHERDMAKYRAYLHGQVRELLTQYGRIDSVFFDFSYDTAEPSVPKGKGAPDWGAGELLAMVRQLQPHIMVNDRLGIPGDFVTPEQYQPNEPMQDASGMPVLWEACQTLNGSWGYDRDNQDYKSSEQLVRMMIDSVANDGNLLLNVGPNGRGELEPEAIERLAAIGGWMRLHERAIRGAGSAPYQPPPDARYTLRGDRLYLHLYAWPLAHVHLPGLAERVDFAQLLHDGSEVPLIRTDPTAAAYATAMGGRPAGTLTLALPIRRPPVLVPVVELFLREQA